jgi:hypothetical protein
MNENETPTEINEDALSGPGWYEWRLFIATDFRIQFFDRRLTIATMLPITSMTAMKSRPQSTACVCQPRLNLCPQR